jgi:ABC-type spermidine/putrescine transport system permease subunit I
MRAERSRALPLELDVLGASVGVALVSGALSVVAPPLSALTGALSVLAVAGWLALTRPTRATFRRTFARAPSVAFVCLAIGAGVFLGASGADERYRGLILGLSLVPLWAVSRRVPRGWT